MILLTKLSPITQKNVNQKLFVMYMSDKGA